MSFGVGWLPLAFVLGWAVGRHQGRQQVLKLAREAMVSIRHVHVDPTDPQINFPRALAALSTLGKAFGHKI